MTPRCGARGGLQMRSRIEARWLIVVAFLALVIAIPAAVLGQTTSTTFVDGTISTADPITFSSGAVVVVTIVDRSAQGGSGVIVGQKRIADPGATPISWSVRYDPAR